MGSPFILHDAENIPSSHFSREGLSLCLQRLQISEGTPADLESPLTPSVDSASAWPVLAMGIGSLN